MEENKEELKKIEKKNATAEAVNETAPGVTQEPPKTKKKTNKPLAFSILGAVIVAITLLTIFVFVPIIKKSKYRGEVGEIITMGTYEQDGDESNGAEEIQWIILAVDGDKELLVSRYALDAQPYNSGSDENETTWEKSSIRIWLNETFYSTVFSKEEKDFIDNTQVETKEYLYKSYNSASLIYEYTADNDGKDYNIISTKDNVFLLSYDELTQYFAQSSTSDKEDMRCMGTQYVIKKNANDFDGYFDWWLRDTMYSTSKISFYSYTSTTTSTTARYVLYKGETVLTNTSSGTQETYQSVSEKKAIRPAMWINLE